jgi:hypothetical protein
MNFLGSILGWIVWNITELVVTQKELEEDGDPSTNLHLKEYAYKKIYYWIGSFFTCLLLLWIGAKGLNLDPLEPLTGHKLGWSDLYYPGAGLAFEALIFLIIRIKTLIKKQ